MGKLLSIIVPCYNEEEMIPLFFEALENISLPIDREYIFIDDGSRDHSLRELKALHKQHPDTVRYVSFSRNFGKEAGIYAGLQESRGDYVVLMDVDLQDPPELLPQMYEILITSDGMDCVGTKRGDRKGEPIIRSAFARLFYRLINKVSDTEIVDGVRDYRMMTRQMVDAVLQITETNRFSKGIFSWVGFNTTYLPYENKEREHGQTTWSFWSLVTYAIDGVVSYSTVPLTIVSLLGVFLFVCSILLALLFAGRTLLYDNPVEGWTSLMVMLLGLGGLQLLALGVLGQYLGKAFLEAKNRPVYIVKETELMAEE